MVFPLLTRGQARMSNFRTFRSLPVLYSSEGGHPLQTQCSVLAGHPDALRASLLAGTARPARTSLAIIASEIVGNLWIMMPACSDVSRLADFHWKAVLWSGLEPWPLIIRIFEAGLVSSHASSHQKAAFEVDIDECAGDKQTVAVLMYLAVGPSV
jgi:hypothetical protein